jgi:hypothetical protein
MKLIAILTLSAQLFLPDSGVIRNSAPRQTTGWLGLYCNKTCALQPATLEYALIANDPDRLDAATSPRGALFVFREVAGLKAGPIAEAMFALDGDLAHDTVLPMTLNGDAYELRVTAANPLYEKAVITLRHGDRSQVIYRMRDEIDEAHIALNFAGDLDGDGKLDLVMTNSPKYSWYPTTLYLSSAAKPGELVREVVTVDRYSC